MTNAKDFMNSFMEKLNNGEFVRDNQPNNGPEMTTEFVKEQVDAFTMLLQDDVIMSIID